MDASKIAALELACGPTLTSALQRHPCPVCGLPEVEHLPKGLLACLGRLLAAAGQ